MPQDSLVLEYRAQVVRRSVADKREQAYSQQGIECYFFGAKEDTVMDSTCCGSLARFTVCVLGWVMGRDGVCSGVCVWVMGCDVMYVY